jgi:hypothetical protein
MNAGVLRRCRRGAHLATTHGSATWPDALRPVHRHNEGALELPIGWRSSTIAVALRQKEQRRRQQTRARRLPLPDSFSHALVGRSGGCSRRLAATLSPAKPRMRKVANAIAPREPGRWIKALAGQLPVRAPDSARRKRRGGDRWRWSQAIWAGAGRPGDRRSSGLRGNGNLVGGVSIRAHQTPVVRWGERLSVGED